MPTSITEKDTSIGVKAQALKEMFLYGQLTLDDLIVQSISLGMDVAQEVHNRVFQGEQI